MKDTSNTEREPRSFYARVRLNADTRPNWTRVEAYSAEDAARTFVARDVKRHDTNYSAGELPIEVVEKTGEEQATALENRFCIAVRRFAVRYVVKFEATAWVASPADLELTTEDVEKLDRALRIG